MKSTLLSAFLLSTLALALAGCGKSSDDRESLASGAADVITQKSKIDAGMKARDQIQAISEQEKKEREDAYELTK